MGLHMKGGVLKVGHGKDDGEITLVNLSYRWRTECEKNDHTGLYNICTYESMLD